MMKKLLFLSLALICSGPVLAKSSKGFDGGSCTKNSDCKNCMMEGCTVQCTNNKCVFSYKPIIPILPIEPGLPEQSKGSTQEEFDDGSTQTIFVGNR